LTGENDYRCGGWYHRVPTARRPEDGDRSPVGKRGPNCLAIAWSSLKHRSWRAGRQFSRGLPTAEHRDVFLVALRFLFSTGSPTALFLRQKRSGARVGLPGRPGRLPASGATNCASTGGVAGPWSQCPSAVSLRGLPDEGQNLPPGPFRQCRPCPHHHCQVGVTGSRCQTSRSHGSDDATGGVPGAAVVRSASFSHLSPHRPLARRQPRFSAWDGLKADHPHHRHDALVGRLGQRRPAGDQFRQVGV